MRATKPRSKICQPAILSSTTYPFLGQICLQPHAWWCVILHGNLLTVWSMLLQAVPWLAAACNPGLMTMELSSPAFASNSAIPAHYTCDGSNASPPLSWSGVPRPTKALLLSCVDPDAPGGTFFHWTAFNLPPDMPGLSEAAGISSQSAFRQAVNNFGHVGYGGPCPPKGDRPHRYRFVLSALDRALADIPEGATCAEVLAAARSSVIASAELGGHYQRG